MNQQIEPQRINSYLDGTLSSDERSKFEAMMRLDKTLSLKVREKKEEYDLFCRLIPNQRPTPESFEMMQTEMRNSVFDLVEEKPDSFSDLVRIKWENLINRLQRD